METVIIILVLLVIFDLVALRRGTDSTENVDSREWERRQDWGLSL